MSYFSDQDPAACWRIFDRHIALIPNAANAKEARQYILEREENAAYSTLGNYLQHIKTFGIYLGERAWRDATRDDVILCIKNTPSRQGQDNRRPTGKPKALAPYTKYQRMVMLREFYKWLLDTTDVPPQFARMPFVKPSMEAQYSRRETRLAKEEIQAMLVATSDAMTRALVMLLLDSGFRAGEASALNISNIDFDEHGAKITHSRDATGLKTRRRKVPIRITVAAPYLRAWLGQHPYRLNPDHAVFISRSHRNHGARLKGSGIWALISRLSSKARIRHVHPHMFRHTAASRRSGDGWNEEMLRLHFGWSKGSEMPSYYARVEDDYDEFVLRKSGFMASQPTQEAWMQECQLCQASNSLEAVYCSACGTSLDGRDAAQ